MTERIQGHGFRWGWLAGYFAACACGWRSGGWITMSYRQARALFEQHKTDVRNGVS